MAAFEGATSKIALGRYRFSAPVPLSFGQIVQFPGLFAILIRRRGQGKEQLLYIGHSADLSRNPSVCDTLIQRICRHEYGETNQGKHQLLVAYCFLSEREDRVESVRELVQVYQPRYNLSVSDVSERAFLEAAS